MCKHSTSAKLQGLLGKPQLAQYADLAFRLKTDTEGQHITLRLRQPGLFLPEAKEILLAHQDLEDAHNFARSHTSHMRNCLVYVTVETIAGETPALTKKDKGKRFDLPV